MSEYGCSKALDYAHEKKRMCDSYEESCVGGLLCEDKCIETRYLTQEHIDIVQKWSDEHPENPLLLLRDKIDELSNIVDMLIGKEEDNNDY